MLGCYQQEYSVCGEDTGGFIRKNISICKDVFLIKRENCISTEQLIEHEEMVTVFFEIREEIENDRVFVLIICDIISNKKNIITKHIRAYNYTAALCLVNEIREER